MGALRLEMDAAKNACVCCFAGNMTHEVRETASNVCASQPVSGLCIGGVAGRRRMARGAGQTEETPDRFCLAMSAL